MVAQDRENMSRKDMFTPMIRARQSQNPRFGQEKLDGFHEPIIQWW